VPARGCPANAELLCDLLVRSGLEVDFLPFDGAHTITPEGLEEAAALAASALPA
jgi:phospholipase/carboxylesterase